MLFYLLHTTIAALLARTARPLRHGEPRQVSIHLVILNFNGRALLAECLPSVVEAAARSRHPCRVSVLDNSSTDDSCVWLAEHFPQVTCYVRPNAGLVSYNALLAELPEQVVVLLNNDIRLADDAIDPLVEPLLYPGNAISEPCFATAPRAWLGDGVTHEGFRTGVCWRWGLVQATARFPGAARFADKAGDTAMAGAVLAVDRARFVALGGFDPLYLPGRIEDLDLGYRAFQAGYVIRYVPASRAWHLGGATFNTALGSATSHRLALRNTLLFQWKHLRAPRHWLTQLIALPVRVVRELLCAPWQDDEQRWLFTSALLAALPKFLFALRSPFRHAQSIGREREFFARYNIPQLQAQLTGVDPAVDEERRWRRHPISRWYLRPIVERCVELLAPGGVRPLMITVAGAGSAALACWAMVTSLPLVIAAICVWFAWVCDRLDGPLARRQQTASETGARWDANLDELGDLLLHVATAAVASRQSMSLLPWFALAGFLIGKGLLLRGMTIAADTPSSFSQSAPLTGWRRLYHLPGNTDVRTHLLLAALLTGCLTAELVLIAAYYATRAAVVWAKRSKPYRRWLTIEGAT